MPMLSSTLRPGASVAIAPWPAKPLASRIPVTPVALRTVLRAASVATRPASLARHAIALPLAALALGAAVPAAAEAAHAVLGPAVLALVFASVAATEASPPARHEVLAAALMLLVTGAICPLAVGAAAAVAHLPNDLAFAATLAASAPVAMGAGALCRRQGIPERPAVWAALGGTVLTPALLPTVAATLPGAATASPAALAGHVTLLGVLPAAAALAFRAAAAKRVADALADDLRGVTVMARSTLALSAGGVVAAAVWRTGPAAAVPLALATAAQAVAVAAAWTVTHSAGTSGTGEPSALRPALLIAVTARNTSFAWAATAAALTPRGEAVLAFAVVGTFTLPALASAAARVASTTRRSCSTSSEGGA